MSFLSYYSVSKVDYCNSVFAGISDQLQDRLQSVLNAAARLVFSARLSERITPLLRELHCLWVPERVTFQLCALAYCCLHGTAPSYLAGSPLWTSDVNTRRRQRSANTAMLEDHPPDVQCSATVPSQWLWHVRETACCLSGMHRRWRRSIASWRRYFFGRRLTIINVKTQFIDTLTAKSHN